MGDSAMTFAAFSVVTKVWWGQWRTVCLAARKSTVINAARLKPA